MKDIGELCLSYGAEGNPTKNVTVTNVPQTWNMILVHHTLNVTFAINRHVWSDQLHTYTQNVSGYRQVTIGMNCSSTTDRCWIRIYWLIGSVKVLVHDWKLVTDGTAYNTFSVQSEMVMVTVTSWAAAVH